MIFQNWILFSFILKFNLIPKQIQRMRKKAKSTRNHVLVYPSKKKKKIIKVKIGDYWVTTYLKEFWAILNKTRAFILI